MGAIGSLLHFGFHFGAESHRGVDSVLYVLFVEAVSPSVQHRPGSRLQCSRVLWPGVVKVASCRHWRWHYEQQNCGKFGTVAM